MEARQQKVPAQDLQQIADGLADEKAKQLYQDLISSAYATKYLRQVSLNAKQLKISSRMV